MSLDLAVATAVTQARLLERALCVAEGWVFEVGGVQLHVKRELHDDHVSFTAFVPAGVSGTDMTLRQGGDFMSTRPFSRPEDTDVEVVWVIWASEPASV